jgi:hypothetical protein
MDDRTAPLRQTAAAVIEQLGPLSGIEFGLNRESVDWVTGFVERQRARPDFDAGMISGLTGAIGCFLGESLIAATGARWEWSDEFGQWSIALGGNNAAYPFGKVRKQLESGLEGGESIISFYDVVVQHLQTGALSKALKS